MPGKGSKLGKALATARESVDLTRQATPDPAPVAAPEATPPEPKTHKELIAAGFVRYNVLLSPEEHKAFKVAAVQEDTDMAALTRRLVQEYLEARSSG